MRLFWIGLPAGLALAAAGLLLLREGQGPHILNEEVISGQPRHPVTLAMRQETGSKSAKVAPAFSVKDSQGREVVLGSPGADRPQFLYFVLEGCPCSFEAEPLFHDLANRFQGQVDFVSITDASLLKAKKWDVQMLVPYSVVPDPRKEIIKAYGAKNSVYSALVSRQGKIVKMWPGYSVDLLQDMNKQLAKEAGVA
ncbi:MAG: peroxiredoxin family protein, partial [Fimbriimonas sp.]